MSWLGRTAPGLWVGIALIQPERGQDLVRRACSNIEGGPGHSLPPERRRIAMPRYLISFDDGSMDHIPEEDWPAVGEAAHAVVREAKAAGIWIFGGGYPTPASDRRCCRWDHHSRTLTGDKGGDRRVLDHRSAFARGGARLGGPDRQSVPVCAGSPRDHVRSGVLIGPRDGRTVWPNAQVERPAATDARTKKPRAGGSARTRG